MISIDKENLKTVFDFLEADGYYYDIFSMGWKNKFDNEKYIPDNMVWARPGDVIRFIKTGNWHEVIRQHKDGHIVNIKKVK